MYTFIQLFYRNALLGLVFITCVLSCFLFGINSYLTEKTSKQKDYILANTEYLNTREEVVDFTKKMQINDSFSILILSSSKGEKLLEIPTNNAQTQIPFITPPTEQVELKKQQLFIHFQFNPSEIAVLFISFSIGFFIFTLILLLIISYMSIKQEKTLFTRICNHIKQEMLQFATQENETAATKELTLNIPELTKGINDIKQLLDANELHAEKLKEKAYFDDLTGLYNRNYFIQFFQNKILQGEDINFGVLMITRCSELQSVNKIHGFKEGDKYIKQVATIMKKELTHYKGSEVFRLNSSDFATIIPNVTVKTAENVAKGFTQQFNSYQQDSNLDSVAYTGLVGFDKNRPLGELLAVTDTAISVAQTQAKNSWYAQNESSLLNNPSINYGNQNWRQEIDGVIENKRISFCIQPIQPFSHKKRMYGEVLTRFLNTNDEILPTSSFIAMAEKLDKIVAIDRLIIDCVIAEIHEKNLTEDSFGININQRSIHDEHFMVWLERRLLRDQEIASRLIFEFTELALQQNIKTSRRFIDMLHRVGSRVTVERFGIGLTSFKFFKELKPDFIKMDSSYTRDIDEDKNNQYFIRVMVDLAHRLSINVLAESVETLEEKHALEQLFIDGCQGYFIGVPEPIETH